MRRRSLVAAFVAAVLTMICGAGTMVMAASEPEQSVFALDMKVSANADDSNVLDLVISVKDIERELDAVEFVLNFDKEKVAGVVTKPGAGMDAFITASPTYLFSISGAEVSVPRYEQICTYHSEKGTYMCRFLDKVSYPNAKPGQSYQGLVRDGDLVITIQFRLLDGVSAEETIAFSATNVKGTTRGTLKSVCGRDAAVVINGEGKPHAHTWTDATCTAPKTCRECGATEGKKVAHKDHDNDGFCDSCQRDLFQEEDATQSPSTGDTNLFVLEIVFLTALTGAVLLVAWPIVNRFWKVRR
jgi:hypothetical protein